MGTVLYEVGFQFEPGLAIVLLVTIGFPIILAFRWRDLPVLPRCFFSVACIFLFVVSIFVFSFHFDMYRAAINAYRSGQYEIVEGYVENFDPLSEEEKGSESFEINGVRFFYSDTKIITGYHNTKKNGGVITGNGQYLKIGYIYYNDSYGNIIVYIEELDIPPKMQ